MIPMLRTLSSIVVAAGSSRLLHKRGNRHHYPHRVVSAPGLDAVGRVWVRGIETPSHLPTNWVRGAAESNTISYRRTRTRLPRLNEGGVKRGGNRGPGHEIACRFWPGKAGQQTRSNRVRRGVSPSPGVLVN